MCDLHSTLVPLILKINDVDRKTLNVFTFYFSSFNSSAKDSHKSPFELFTFYFSSFNSKRTIRVESDIYKFTFYFSSFNSQKVLANSRNDVNIYILL